MKSNMYYLLVNGAAWGFFVATFAAYLIDLLGKHGHNEYNYMLRGAVLTTAFLAFAFAVFNAPYVRQLLEAAQ